MSRTYTSRTLRSVAYCWMTFPLAYIVYGMIVLGFNMTGILQMVLSPWYWLVTAMAVVSAYGVLGIRWYGWYAFLFSNFMITYQTAVALTQYSVRDYKLAAFVGTIFLQALATYIVGREIRVPYFFPRIRWWESDPRYKLSVPTKLVRGDKSEFEGEIMDLSLGGCFIKTHSYFVPDEEVTLDFSLFERAIQCTGKVVWRTESTVTHPKGIGVKFEILNKETVFCLKQATQKLRKLARVYSQMTREKNWQEYLQREERYQGSTPGVPKKK